MVFLYLCSLSNWLFWNQASIQIGGLLKQMNFSYKEQRGSVCASHQATPGLNLGQDIFFQDISSQYCLVCEWHWKIIPINCFLSNVFRKCSWRQRPELGTTKWSSSRENRGGHREVPGEESPGHRRDVRHGEADPVSWGTIGNTLRPVLTQVYPRVYARKVLI